MNRRGQSRAMKSSVAGPEQAVRSRRERIANRWGDMALLIVPGVIWGASFLFIAEGLEAVAPNGVTFTRIAIGFLTLSLFPSARQPVARADWAGTAALGVLWFAFPLVCSRSQSSTYHRRSPGC